jgi:DNA-binding protein WhiA
VTGHAAPLSSEDVRAELASIAPARACDALAEVSALLHTAGTVHLLGRARVAIHADLASSAVARRGFALLRGLGIHSEIRTYRRHAFGRETRYQLHVEGDDNAFEVMAKAGVLDRRHAPLEAPPRRLVGRACCRSAYLRGAFLGAGTLSGPRSPHLEVRVGGGVGAELQRAVADACGVPLAIASRASHVAVYAKGWDAIEGFLAAAGAVDTVLALEERAVISGARSEANRLANADHANLVRVTRAAQTQAAAARGLRDAGVLAELPERLREAGELRLRFPTSPLAELARRASPPTTKASMHRRLSRLVELAGR